MIELAYVTVSTPASIFHSLLQQPSVSAPRCVRVDEEISSRVSSQHCHRSYSFYIHRFSRGVYYSSRSIPLAYSVAMLPEFLRSIFLHRHLKYFPKNCDVNCFSYGGSNFSRTSEMTTKWDSSTIFNHPCRIIFSWTFSLRSRTFVFVFTIVQYRSARQFARKIVNHRTFPLVLSSSSFMLRMVVYYELVFCKSLRFIFVVDRFPLTRPHCRSRPVSCPRNVQKQSERHLQFWDDLFVDMVSGQLYQRQRDQPVG